MMKMPSIRTLFYCWFGVLSIMLWTIRPSYAAEALIPPAGPAPTTLTKTKPFAVVGGGNTSAAQGGSVNLRYTIYLLDKEHYLYKERMSLQLSPSEGISFGPVQFSPKPESKFDSFEARNMEIYHETATMYVQAILTDSAKLGSRSIEAEVKYQGCNPSVCFFPTKEKLILTLDVTKKLADATASPIPADSAGASSSAGVPSESGLALSAAPTLPSPVSPSVPRLESRTLASHSDTAPEAVADPLAAAFSGSLWNLFFLVFLGGIGASLTPCIYPIIPITISILGAKNARSKLHGFLLAVTYVLGLSVTYTILGISAAVTGSLFGSWMQSPWVNGGVAALFILMGFGMLGAFSVALPSSMSSRLSNVQGRGFPGAFLAGTVAGLVASPCVGPLIVSLLTYIAKTHDIALGAALMFVFAMGMGQLFILLGTFAVQLPRSGAWMNVVKGTLALLLFAMGLYYLRNLIPAGYFELLVGVSAIVAATFVGGFDVLDAEATVTARIQKVAGVLFLVVGILSVSGGLLHTRLIGAPLINRLIAIDGPATLASAPQATRGIVWDDNYAAAMARASSTNSPVLLDFTAEWCAACKELEHLTYTDARVIAAARSFVPIKIDGTEGTPEFVELQKKYGVVGLPSVLFLEPSGVPIHDLTVTGFVAPDEFLRRMCKVGSEQVASLVQTCNG